MAEWRVSSQVFLHACDLVPAEELAATGDRGSSFQQPREALPLALLWPLVSEFAREIPAFVNPISPDCCRSFPLLPS